MAKSGILDPGSCSKIWIFSNTIFLRVFEKIEPDKGGHFQNTIFLRVFEKWDPDIFQKSEISKISCSSHSENAHIKLNGFQWVFGGWGDAPFIFFMGRMGQKSKNGPSRAVYPPGWGNRYFKNEGSVSESYRNLLHPAPRWSGGSTHSCTCSLGVHHP